MEAVRGNRRTSPIDSLAKFVLRKIHYLILILGTFQRRGRDGFTLVLPTLSRCLTHVSTPLACGSRFMRAKTPLANAVPPLLYLPSAHSPPSPPGTFLSILRNVTSLGSKDRLITRYVLPVLGARDASTLTRADVRAMLSKIDRPVLQNQVLASTSAIFTWASRQEILPHNPCKGI
jgi:hypothetical protein